MRRQNANIDIAMIEPSEKHYYQPGFTIIGGGAYTLKETTRNEADLIHPHVTWIKDYAETFQPDENSVTLRSGDKSPTTIWWFALACNWIGTKFKA